MVNERALAVNAMSKGAVESVFRGAVDERERSVWRRGRQVILWLVVRLLRF